MKNNFFDKKTIGIFIFFSVIYLYFLIPVSMPLSNVALDVAISVVDRGKFEVVNKNFFDTTRYEEKYYPVFPPGLIFLAIPVYIITKPMFGLVSPFLESSTLMYDYSWLERTPVPSNILILYLFCTILILIPVAVLIMVFFYKFLGEFSQNENHKLITTIFLGLGTFIFPHSTYYYKNTIGVLLLFLSFYILFKIKHKSLDVKFLLLAGFLAGAVSLFHYFQISVVPLLSFYLLTFIRDRKIILFFLGLIPPILGILTYHWSISGNPFLPPCYLGDYPETVGFNMGFFGFGFPHLETIYGLTISPFRGLFLYSPILLLAFYGLFLKIKSRFSTEMWFILAVFIVVFLGNASLQSTFQWSGANISFGPRHLITMTPFLMIPLVFLFGKLKKWIIIIGIISIFINYLGASHHILLTSSEAGFLFEKDAGYLFYSLYNFIQNGPISPLTKFLFSNNLLAINIAGLLILFFSLFIIWRKFLINDKLIK